MRNSDLFYIYLLNETIPWWRMYANKRLDQHFILLVLLCRIWAHMHANQPNCNKSFDDYLVELTSSQHIGNLYTQPRVYINENGMYAKHFSIIYICFVYIRKSFNRTFIFIKRLANSIYTSVHNYHAIFKFGLYTEFSTEDVLWILWLFQSNQWKAPQLKWVLYFH